MTNLSTNYLGLDLKSPIIISSSELTNSIENIKEFERQGAGAVVLKSLLEEQINVEFSQTISQNENNGYIYPEAEDYIRNYTAKNSIDNYLHLIKDLKKEVSIPIIASINCTSASEWVNYAKKIEDAGADAIELNIFIFPSDPDKHPEENEDIYFDIVNELESIIKIPIALKISNYFSSLAYTVKKLSWTKIKGIVMFNRFYNPDIDIHKMEITSADIHSSNYEYYTTLKWTAILSDIVECDLCASTGIHDGETAIKQLLAGAKAVQICSTLYNNGFGQIAKINQEIENWMKEKGFKTIEDFRGKLNIANAQNPAAWERIQFMKYYAGIL